MKYLKSIDLTNKGESKYTIYFYHKYVNTVWKVITNGTKCAMSIAEECEINKELKSGYSLPKYILKELKDK